MKITWRQQLEVLENMQSDGYNVCTCGSCGGTLLYDKAMRDAEYIVCPHCKSEMGYSDNPDWLVEGLEILNTPRFEAIDDVYGPEQRPLYRIYDNEKSIFIVDTFNKIQRDTTLELLNFSLSIY